MSLTNFSIYLFRKARRIPEYVRYGRWSLAHRLFSDKYPLIQLEFNIVYGCNLNCDYCSHLSQYDRGMVSLHEFTEWSRLWTDRLAPMRIRLLGGEPLLHPELREILFEAKSKWPESTIQLVSNGLLLPEKADIVLPVLKRIGGEVHLSQHFRTPEYDRIFREAVACLKRYGVRGFVIPSGNEWIQLYEIDETGRPQPRRSDPSQAWNNCRTKRCVTCYEGKIYSCSYLPMIRHLVSKNRLPESWNRAAGHVPLLPDCTDEELRDYFHKPFQECEVCPETYRYVPLAAISSDFHGKREV